MAAMIPAFLCVDVEPDDKGPEIGAVPWTGFPATADLVDRMRGPLGDRSGVEPHALWSLRMDPAIERTSGRVDYVVSEHGDVIERLEEHGDFFGIHVHSHRWDDEHGYTYSDHSDVAFSDTCIAVAAQTFQQTFGEPPRRSRMGGRYIPEHVVDALIGAGIQVDLTVEPGLPAIDDDDSFGHHATAPSRDFTDFPTYPYRVSRTSLGQPASDDADSRPLVEIPLTAYDYVTALTPLKLRARRRVGRMVGKPPRPRSVQPMNMWELWPSPAKYWDLVERAIDESPVPYFAFVMRSGPPDQGSNARVREVLEHLPHHRVSKRLAFVDPLTLADLPAGASALAKV